jgi:hypothetical protein
MLENRLDLANAGKCADAILEFNEKTRFKVRYIESTDLFICNPCNLFTN